MQRNPIFSNLPCSGNRKLIRIINKPEVPENEGARNEDSQLSKLCQFFKTKCFVFLFDFVSMLLSFFKYSKENVAYSNLLCGLNFRTGSSDWKLDMHFKVKSSRIAFFRITTVKQLISVWRALWISVPSILVVVHVKWKSYQSRLWVISICG